jgi:hypothetical protein
MRTFRLILFAFVLTCTAGWSQSSSVDLRAVDFKNFSYPWIHPNGWPHHLQWMSLRLKQHIQLVNGKWDERDDSDRAYGTQFSGLTLEGVQFVRLSSEHSEDAIVVLRYDSGGTQYHYWVYIYGNSAGIPKLLGFFHAGDRAANGLYEVFEKDRILNVRLFDPKFEEADCCSSGYLDYQFRWNGKGFDPIGNPIPGRADSTSRRPVSVFGLPIDQP